MLSTDQEIEEMTGMLEARVGPLDDLYERLFDGHRVHGSKNAEAEEDFDEELPFRLLCPPVSPQAVDAAEQKLGFPLPALLRAVYTRIGNGGYCLHLQ